jgi:hypothetical protein
MLKPDQAVMTSAAVLAVVTGVFALQVPNSADVRMAKPGNTNVHATAKTAAIESMALVAAISLLSKSPEVFVTGGLFAAGLFWHYAHANAHNGGAKAGVQQVQAS